jgi:hypothetical protein
MIKFRKVFLKFLSKDLEFNLFNSHFCRNQSKTLDNERMDLVSF